MNDALAPFNIGWPVSRDDGLDDLERFVREPEFRPRFRLPGGQFALCARDERSGRAAALRDPSASIPLHAYYDGRRWLVSHSVRAIENCLGRKFSLKLDALKKLHQNWVLELDQSIYHEVKLCAPNVVHLFEPDGKISYFPVEIEWPTSMSVDPSQRSNANALAESVAYTVSRSICDAAGSAQAIVQQSGGLDSNLILHAGVHAGRQLAAMGLIFPGLDCDEMEPMQASSGMAAVSFYPVDYDGKDYTFWKEDLLHRSEYVPFTTTFMPLSIAQNARKLGHRILLNGMGGDEIFATSSARSRAFLSRLNPGLALGKMRPQELNVFLRGLARLFVSGRQKSLSSYLYSGNWYFQMCATQLLLDEGVELRLPFCDWRTVVEVRPLAALDAIHGQGSRTLQRALLDYFTPGLASRVGLQKANFNVIGSAFATMDDDRVLGPSCFPRFEALIPAFIRCKQAEGRKLV